VVKPCAGGEEDERPRFSVVSGAARLLVDNAFLVILTLLLLEVLVLILTRRWAFLNRWINSAPLVLMQEGEPIDDHLKKSMVDESDILEQARSSQGLERLDQIKYAVLERDGSISIIPRSGD
jgi:uncharacterized membrane protein YcaP (DUF421 family)